MLQFGSVVLQLERNRKGIHIARHRRLFVDGEGRSLMLHIESHYQLYSPEHCQAFRGRPLVLCLHPPIHLLTLPVTPRKWHQRSVSVSVSEDLESCTEADYSQ